MKITNVFSLVTLTIQIVLFCGLNTAQAQTSKTNIEVIPGQIFGVTVSLSANEYTLKFEDLNGAKINQITTFDFDQDILYNFIKTSYEKNKPTLSPTQLIQLQPKASLKFMVLLGGLYNLKAQGQHIGSVKVRHDKLPLLIKKSTTPEVFTVISVSLVFEDGFIKSIKAKGKIGNVPYTYSNAIGIGITTRRNNRNLIRHKLYNDNNINDDRYIFAGELLDYQMKSGLRTNDHSPVDQAIEIFANQGPVNLYKSPRTKLFSWHIFSDFAGINEDNPNGLIQTSLTKRINVWTRRLQINKTVGLGFITHIKPSFTLSKVENNNRITPLSLYNLDGSDDILYVSPLEVFRYGVANASVETNIFDLQGAVINIHLNGIFGFNHAQLRDTIIVTAPDPESAMFNDESLNSAYLGYGAKVIFFPESKWSFQMESKGFWFENLKDDINFHSLEKGELTSPNIFLHTIELLGTTTLKDGNKLFARYRLNHEWLYPDNNFSEWQVGYSLYLKSGVKNKP